MGKSPASDERQDTSNAHARTSGAGVPPAVFLPPESRITMRSRRLPHWEVRGAVYFVTFRLADSLPKHALQKIVSQRMNIPVTAAQMSRRLTPSERKKLGQLHARRIERSLDAGAGECFLRNPAIARVVANALKEFDGSRYRLFAWSVMPNHVHVLFQTIGKTSLADILHSWKSYSAKAANQILGRNGEFWQREYHDHLIRNMTEFDRAVRYVMENPGKAGLKDWPWVWSWK
jgi:REP element-mobilizing transposase RayT